MGICGIELNAAEVTAFSHIFICDRLRAYRTQQAKRQQRDRRLYYVSPSSAPSVLSLERIHQRELLLLLRVKEVRHHADAVVQRRKRPPPEPHQNRFNHKPQSGSSPRDTQPNCQTSGEDQPWVTPPSPPSLSPKKEAKRRNNALF